MQTLTNLITYCFSSGTIFAFKNWPCKEIYAWFPDFFSVLWEAKVIAFDTGFENRPEAEDICSSFN